MQAQSLSFEIDGCCEMGDGYGLLVTSKDELWVIFPVPDKEHYIRDIERFEFITLDTQDFKYLHPTQETTVQ